MLQNNDHRGETARILDSFYLLPEHMPLRKLSSMAAFGGSLKIQQACPTRRNKLDGVLAIF